METIKRTKIVDVLKSEAFGTTVNVKGWVRTRRGSKQVNFIALNDGSTINNVQIVVDVDKLGDEFLKPITTGASISVNGILTQSQGKGQSVERKRMYISVSLSRRKRSPPSRKTRILPSSCINVHMVLKNKKRPIDSVINSGSLN